MRRIYADTVSPLAARRVIRSLSSAKAKDLGHQPSARSFVVPPQDDARVSGRWWAVTRGLVETCLGAARDDVRDYLVHLRLHVRRHLGVHVVVRRQADVASDVAAFEGARLSRLDDVVDT